METKRLKVAVIVTNPKPDLPCIGWHEPNGPANTVIYRLEGVKGICYGPRHLNDYVVDFTHEKIISWGDSGDIPKDVCREKFDADFGIYFAS